ncbi:ectonucleoside triphosphate diphosphohydrolase 3 [Heterodontus francisci]|uniref:ectonucleoside triphosphate diphosphohydrolase 3 n=1 Tax=Heterodontus francisci TaxID=7792 RepID=UPI00355C2779
MPTSVLPVKVLEGSKRSSDSAKCCVTLQLHVQHLWQNLPLKDWPSQPPAKVHQEKKPHFNGLFAARPSSFIDGWMPTNIDLVRKLAERQKTESRDNGQMMGWNATCPNLLIDTKVEGIGGCRMGLKRPVAATLIVLFSSVIIVVTISVLQQLQKVTLPIGNKYGIVFDAGASRTIVYVYSWPAEKENNTGVVSERYMCQIEGPAISSYDNEPEQAAHSMKQCLNRTMEIIPVEKHNTTPVYFGATAGMRLLQLENTTAASMILSAIKDYLRSSPFDFRGAQIISGREEGVYGWITANYLLDYLRQRRTWKQLKRTIAVKTTGTLDLGGASTEIAFVPKQHSHKHETTIITLYSYKYKVYTQSLACYGRDEAEKKYRAKLIQKSTRKSSIEDPCLHSNYNLTIRLMNIFDSLCTEAETPKTYNPDNNVTFIGTGEPLLCQQKILLIFKFKQIYSEGNWIPRNRQPSIHGDFVAFSGFYYTMEVLNLTRSFSMETFHSTVRAFCQKSWDQVQQLLPNVTDSFRRAYCFNANYIYALLVQGYKFDRLSWTQISFQKQVENSSIGWSLGYMLNLTNMIPSENQVIQTPMSEAVFCGLLFLFSTLVLFCSMFICMSVLRSI